MNNKSKKNHIDSILRVDHAGETAAAKIYDGQLAVLKNTPVGPTIQHMKDQEQEHLDTCLLYTSPSPRDTDLSRMPSSA